MYGYESWTIKKTDHWGINAFELWCWRRLLRIPWNARRSNQSILKEINSEYSLEGQMLKLKLQSFGHLIRKADSLEKTGAGQDWGQEEKRAVGDEMVGWHHWFNGHEFEQALGDSEGQGSLACCSPWRCQESDITERLNNNNRVEQQYQFCDIKSTLSPNSNAKGILPQMLDQEDKGWEKKNRGLQGQRKVGSIVYNKGLTWCNRRSFLREKWSTVDWTTKNHQRPSSSWHLRYSFCAAVDHSFPVGIKGTGALRTLPVLVSRTFSLSGFLEVIFFLSSVIWIWPWLSTQGNVYYSVLLWRFKKGYGFLSIPRKSHDFFYLRPQGWVAKVVYSNLSFPFQLPPPTQNIFLPLVTCLAWHHMLNESELSRLNAADTKIVLLISDALFTFPWCL